MSQSTSLNHTLPNLSASLSELLPTIPRTPSNGLQLDLLAHLVSAIHEAPANRKTGTLRDLVPRIVLLLKQLQTDPDANDPDDPVAGLLNSMKR